MKFTSRAALAVALLVGFYLFALGIVAVLVWLLVLAINAGISGPLVAKLGFFVAAIGIAIVVGLLWRSNTTDEPHGVLITEGEQPSLWREVRSIAEQVGTRAPDEIRLVADLNAGVTENTKFLGLVSGTRRLYLGVPLLLGLDRQQARGVIAHELGHYSEKHTALAAITYRGKDAIARVLKNLGSSSLVAKILRQYAKLYVAVSSSVNRRQELDADRFSAQIAGRDAAASALQEAPALAPVWAHFLSAYSGMGSGQGLRPAQLFAGYSTLLADPETQEGMSHVRENPDEPEFASRYDSHPPIAERVAAIRATDAPDEIPGTDRAAPAISLFDDPDAAFAALEAEIFAGSELKPTDWDTLTHTHITHTIAGSAGTLRAVLEGVGDAPTLRSGIARLRGGGATGLFNAPDDVEGDRAEVAHLVADAAADQLVTRRDARFRVRWGRPATFATADGTERDVWAGVVTVTDDASADAWQNELVAWGIDLDAELPDAPAAPSEVPADQDELVGAVAVVTGKLGNQLVVSHRGIVVRKHDGGDRWAAALRGLIGSASEAVLQRLTQRRIQDIVADPRSTVIPYAEIISLEVQNRRVGATRLLITRGSGAPVTVTLASGYRIVGEPFEAIEHYLGDRFRAA